MTLEKKLDYFNDHIRNIISKRYEFENYSLNNDSPAFYKNTIVFGQSGSGKTFILKEAICRLIKEKNPKVRILIAGDKGEFEDIIKIAKENGFDNKIELFEVDWLFQIREDKDKTLLTNILSEIEEKIKLYKEEKLHSFVFFSFNTYDESIVHFLKIAKKYNCVVTLDGGCDFERFTKEEWRRLILYNTAYSIILSLCLRSDLKAIENFYCITEEQVFKFCHCRGVGEGLVLTHKNDTPEMFINIKEDKNSLWTYMHS